MDCRYGKCLDFMEMGVGENFTRISSEFRVIRIDHVLLGHVLIVNSGVTHVCSSSPLRIVRIVHCK